MKKLVLILGIVGGLFQAQGQSFVGSIVPSRNAQNVRASTTISLSFTTDITPSTLTQSTVKVSGSLSGTHVLKSISYIAETRSAFIAPVVNFSSGETVTITIATAVRSTTNEAMPAPFVSQFTVASKAGSGVLALAGYTGTGNQPWAAATADFDHDGVLDFLVLNRTSKSVSLLKNYGSGNFHQDIAPVAVGTSPSSFAVADFNGDDIPDCAVANEGANTVTLLFMDSKGTTTRTATFSAPGAPSAIVAADLDGDGDMDLIVAGRTSNAVYVYKNDGTGTFTLSSTTQVGAGPSALATADFNNDDIMDVAVTSETANSVTVLVNNGTGTLTASTPIAVASGPVSLATGDFDGDGAIDLVVASKSSSKMSVLRNDGTGYLYTAAVIADIASPTTVAAGDMDGDGNCDIVGLGTVVQVFHNQGYFQFLALPSVNAGSTPHGLVLTDIDGDGDLDCATPNSVSSSLALFTNRPGVFISVTPASLDFGLSRSGVAKQLSVLIHNYGVAVPLNIMSVTSSNPPVFSCAPPTGLIAPLDSTTMTVVFTPGDAKNYSDSLTLATNDPTRPTLKVYVKGVGGLVVLSTSPLPYVTVSDSLPQVTASFNGAVDGSSFRSSTMRLFGDMTGLHPAQFAVSTSERRAVATPSRKFLPGEHVTAVLTDSITAASGTIRLLNGYTLNFSVLPARGTDFYAAGASYTTGDHPSAAAAGDFNGDGFGDIAVLNSNDNTVSVFLNDTHGGLTLQAVYTLGATPQALVVADVNEDGAPDLVAVNVTSSTVTVLLNRNLKDGSFVPGVVTVTTGGSPQAVAVGDFNNDGHLDIATANTKDNTISLFTSDGAAHFTLWKTIAVGSSPRAISAADFNNDGVCDIAVLNAGASSIMLLLNVNGTFIPSTYATGGTPTTMTVNDFNGDGFLDIVTANSATKSLSVYLNSGSGTFIASPAIFLPNAPTALFSGDMSGDGLMDLVVAESSGNVVQILTNNGYGGFVQGDSISVNSPVAVAGFDLNNRGILHLAVPNQLTARLTLVNPAPGQTPSLISPSPYTSAMKAPVTLVWQNTGRTTQFHVEVADSAAGMDFVSDSTVLLRQYTVPTLAFSTTYKWRVRAKNDNGWGEFSAWWSFATIMAPPQTPVLTAPARFAIDQDAAPQFVWQRALTAAKYRIQVSQDSLFATRAIDSLSADTLWQSSALKVHAKYFWRVKAMNAGGESDWSDARSFTTLLPVPNQVRLAAPVNNARLGSATIKFSWNVTPWEVKKYWFEIAADTLFMFRIVDSAVTDTLWQMQKFSGNQKYYWKVRALNATGWGPFSDVSTFSIGATSVGTDGTLPDHFALEQNYPNPFNPSTQIQFALAAACPVQLTIYDILGRQVATLVNEQLPAGTFTVRWNAHEFPSGVYIYRLTAGSYVSTKKLSLQK